MARIAGLFVRQAQFRVCTHNLHWGVCLNSGFRKYTYAISISCPKAGFVYHNFAELT